MTTSTIDESQRKAARVAGFFYLLTFAIVVVVNFGINERLMVAGNPAQTARNILAHERLFRIGIASNLLYEAGLLALLSALYVPSDRQSQGRTASYRLFLGGSAKRIEELGRFSKQANGLLGSLAD